MSVPNLSPRDEKIFEYIMAFGAKMMEDKLINVISEQADAICDLKLRVEELEGKINGETEEERQ